MENYMGEQLQLFVVSGSSANTIACATNLTVNIERESVDVSCKDTGKYGASIGGKINWTIETENLFLVTEYRKFVKYLQDGTPLVASWATVDNYEAANAAGGDADGHIFNDTTKAESAEDLYYGTVTVASCELTANNGSLSTYRVTLNGKGAINDSAA